jgi:hypothetical protein
MAQIFVPLKANLIDEGEFIENVDAELQALQKQLWDFVKKYELKAEKSVAELTIKVKIMAANVESNAFSITTSMSTKVPKRPDSISLAIGDDEGNLLVREMGSDKTRPEQGKLFKTHGSGTETE